MRTWLLCLFILANLGQVALAQSALPAVVTTPPSTLTDVQLTGTVTWHLGPDSDSGTFTLAATRSGQSRIDLQLSSGTRSEVRLDNGMNSHLYLGTSGNWTESAVHNSFVDANWFFPLFSTAALASERSFVITSAGTASVQTQLSPNALSGASAATLQTLSTATFDVDPTTHLPTRMRWSTHPDNDYGVNIRYEVRYSNYQMIHGVAVPFHIQRYFNGMLELDLTITNVVLNPGVPSSDFSPVTN